MITDLLGGQIQLTVNNKSVLLPHIVEGRLKPLAVASKERWQEIPNVPTLIEAGYFTSSFDVVFGIVAPAGTPSAAVNAINAAINETLTSPEVRASFANLGIEPRAITPQEFGSFMADDAPRWAEVVRATMTKSLAAVFMVSSFGGGFRDKEPLRSAERSGPRKGNEDERIARRVSFSAASTSSAGRSGGSQDWRYYPF